MLSKKDFGEDFIWGVASSAYQIEGEYNTKGKGLSIWDNFSSKKGKIKKNQTAKNGTNFYNNFEEDISLIKDLNTKHYRFSISWSRLLPSGIGEVNMEGVMFYNRLINDCLIKGLTPWVTLYHWDLPLVLQEKGGWKNREILDWFNEFIRVCVLNFGDRVKHWMILNEPTAFIGLGYFLGVHAPGLKGLNNFLPSALHASLCMANGGRYLKSILPDSIVGSTFSFSSIEPASKKESDIQAAVRVDSLLNRFFLEPVLGLGYPLKTLPKFKKIEKYFREGDENKLEFEFDFIGAQNYSREVIAYSCFTPYVHAKLVSAKKRNKEVTAMDWEFYPKAIFPVLNQLNKYKNIPKLIITECGVALKDKPNNSKVSDPKRIEFLEVSLSEVKQFKALSKNIYGYFVWSITDNFEWAEGFSPRFGLVYIDYDNYNRIPKESYYWFQNFLK